MSRNNPEAEIDRLMIAAINDLEAAAAANRMNHYLAKLLGSIANLLGHQEILKPVESLLAKLTAADLFGAAITIIDWQNLDSRQLNRLRSVEPADTFGAAHPVYDRASPVPDLQKYSLDFPHMQLCLQGNTAAAVAVAQTDAAYEEIANTLAALGRFDEAVNLIDSLPVSRERRRGVSVVVLIEKCRRLVPGFAGEIDRFNPLDFDRLHVILALAARRPWQIYPYSDY
jgi:hypothetical protein